MKNWIIILISLVNLDTTNYLKLGTFVKDVDNFYNEIYVYGHIFKGTSINSGNYRVLIFDCRNFSLSLILIIHELCE